MTRWRGWLVPFLALLALGAVLCLQRHERALLQSRWENVQVEAKAVGARRAELARARGVPTVEELAQLKAEHEALVRLQAELAELRRRSGS